MGRYAWQFLLLLNVVVGINLLPLKAYAGGGSPCQQPIVSRYCSSTQLDMLTPQKGRADVFFVQIIKAYKPELLTGSDYWGEDPAITSYIKDFHKRYDIANFIDQELGGFTLGDNKAAFGNKLYLSEPLCYRGGGFDNLSRYYKGLESTDLDRAEIQQLVLLRLGLIQDCLFDVESYSKSAADLKVLRQKSDGSFKAWENYIDAAASYHDGFFPEAAEKFASVARGEANLGRREGWLIETSRYMEVLSLFHVGREGQEEVFLPTIFNSFAEKFLEDFPGSEYASHVADMAAGIWLHSGDRERYFEELLKSVKTSQVFQKDVETIDELDRLAVNALIANMDEISIKSIKHTSGFTLVAAILAMPKDVKELCSQVAETDSDIPSDLVDYSKMACGYLLHGQSPAAEGFKNTPLYNHALAFEAQFYLEKGQFEQAGKVISLLAASDTELTDLFAIRSLQLEARLKDKAANDFVLLDKVEHSLELQVMDAILYEQLSRYFLSAEALEKALKQTKNPLHQFALIRPHLDEAMINENWNVASALAGQIDWEETLNSDALMVSGKLKQEVQFYSDTQEDLLVLSLDAKEAKALSDVGYFLYENHIAPRCGYVRTALVESYMDRCRSGYANPGITKWGWEEAKKDLRAPIELFEEALNIHRKIDGNQVEEARLLRIMIFCAKGANNVGYCLRWKDIPKKKFQGWFESLSKNYPKSEQVKYWYYDLPHYSGFTDEAAKQLEQEFWYDEDAYLGYLDLDPYNGAAD